MLSLIAALDKNGLIGQDNQLPWNIPEDLQHFKKITLNSYVVMGYNTFSSLKAPLRQRKNIILDRTVWPAVKRTVVYYPEREAHLIKIRNWPTILSFLANKDAYIIGGAKIYEQALEMNVVDRLILSRIDGEYEGNVFFPKIDWSKWALQDTIRLSDLVKVEYYESKRTGV